ncbi:hypothetical protein CB0940_11999 [Cercospora beticola]|uniref:Retrovirus-related Pol polyprotein from transposon TNT 1-94-like beta-barrel domain-containing protein n=1 Tax=Cercospora beticola TaxID=122368 RepID=A0A2G5IE58_CERBT|nr:hypothetical protein CB0940_11999 [Cercospora beticola]PIB02942.1 hypothetical protein CB0940_11999 [Cercospora beticola]WPB04381.1 hypothetical protein RHO25_009027 [Cercospora beticola]CAK1356793.1 unnamed protein product [Cercospora beticola]
MAPTGSDYQVDWLWISKADAHVANHRDWFTTFKPIKSYIGDTYRGENEVLGIGDVELSVKVRENRTGPKSKRTLVLKDVLYVPKMICNIIGRPILDEYDVNTDSDKKRGELRHKATGAAAGIFDCPGLSMDLQRLRLVGLSATQTSLDPNPYTLYLISVDWNDEKRAKWMPQTNSEGSKRSEEPEKPRSGVTEELKAWFEVWYGNTFNISWGFKLENDEQRAEERETSKADREMEEEEKDSGEEENQTGEEENDFLADPEAGSASHGAPYQFTKAQLDWLNENYANTRNSM